MAEQAFNIEGIDDLLSRLQALPKEISTKRGGPARMALRKGGNVMRDEMRRNIGRIVDAPNIGGDNESTGLMQKSVSVVRARKMLGGERMFVLIPKRKRYPISTKTPSGIPIVKVARMLEYGTARNPNQHQWARPAFHAKKEEVVRTIVTELRNGIDKIVKKLSRGIG